MEGRLVTELEILQVQPLCYQMVMGGGGRPATEGDVLRGQDFHGRGMQYSALR